MIDATQWPGELDALLAAPKNHSLLFENNAVRVLDTSVAPGETVPLHTHIWPSTLYLLSWSDFVRRDANGTVLLDSRNSDPPKDGAAFWAPAMPAHTLENVGDRDLHVISVELKPPQQS